MNLSKIIASCVMPRIAGVLSISPTQSRCAHLLARVPSPPGPTGAGLLQNTMAKNLISVPSCGLKQKGLLKRRCKDCYFVYRDGRKFVMCSSKPRHKAAAFAPREKFTWVLSPGPMQSKQRAW